MKRRVLPLALLLTVQLFLPHVARGHTVPSPPNTRPVGVSSTSAATTRVSVTPGADARPVLEAMQRAIIAAGTLHYTFGGTALAPTRRQIVMSNRGTMSFPSNSLHEVRTTEHTSLSKKPYISVIERSEFKVVGKNASWRAPHMSWQCESLRSAHVNTNLLVFAAIPVTAEFRGTGTVDGVAVWHIRARSTIDPWTADRVDTVQYDVAQATGLPIRMWTSFPIRLNGARARQTLSESYSHYGEPVHITLPAKCAARAGNGD